MSATWYIWDAQGNVRGPMTGSNLKGLASDKKITATTLVRRGEAGEWLPAGKVRGLFADLEPSSRNPARDGKSVKQADDSTQEGAATPARPVLGEARPFSGNDTPTFQMSTSQIPNPLLTHRVEVPILKRSSPEKPKGISSTVMLAAGVFGLSVVVGLSYLAGTASRSNPASELNPESPSNLSVPASADGSGDIALTESRQPGDDGMNSAEKAVVTFETFVRACNDRVPQIIRFFGRKQDRSVVMAVAGRFTDVVQTNSVISPFHGVVTVNVSETTEGDASQDREFAFQFVLAINRDQNVEIQKATGSRIGPGYVVSEWSLSELTNQHQGRVALWWLLGPQKMAILTGQHSRAGAAEFANWASELRTWVDQDLTRETSGTSISNRSPLPPSDTAAVAEAEPLVWPFDKSAAKAGQLAWAKRMGKAVVEKNSIGMDLVVIPPGTFTMGSPPGEEEFHEDNENQVSVTLTRAFQISRTEVTQGEWKAVMGTEPWQGSTFAKEGRDYPASNVSWEDTEAFCEKLSSREGKVYRLPTEADWEWACRAGTKTAWSFGASEGEFGRYAWFLDNASYIDGRIGERYAHRVGQKLPNGFGLSDMHGNLWEWCGDWYGEKLEGGRNPVGASSGSDRVLRGGDWMTPAGHCRSAHRYHRPPSFAYPLNGFRVVLSPSGG